MSSIPTKQIDGDVAVGRNVSAGGNATIQGNVRIGHNLKVEGWLDARNIKGPNKGIFLDVTKLRETYPLPHDGWWALVGNTLPAPLYIADGGAWVATGETAGNPTVDSQQYNEAVAQLDSDLKVVAAEVSANRQSIAQIRTQIDTIGGSVNSLTSAVSGLNTRMSNAESAIESVRDGVSSNSVEIESNKSAVEALEGRVDRHDAAIGTLEGEQSALDGRISEVASDVSAIGGAVGTLEERAESHEVSINSLSEAVGEKGEQIRAIAIVPFDGVYDPENVPESGVWFRRYDSDEGGTCAMWAAGGEFPAGFTELDYNTTFHGFSKIREDVIFRAGNELYRFNGMDLVRSGGSSTGNCYNVTNERPLAQGEFYDLEGAVAATFAAGVAALGLQISFAIRAGSWKTYQFVGVNVTEPQFKAVGNWIDLAGMSAGDEPVINVNKLCGGELYNLSTAIVAVRQKEQATGLSYFKPGVVLTYRRDVAVWESKQYLGEVADISEVDLKQWVDFGGGGSDVETADTPEEGGADAFSTGGAYTMEQNMIVDIEQTEDAENILLQGVNRKGNAVGSQVKIPKSSGGGQQSGSSLSIFLEDQALYGAFGSRITTRIAVKSVSYDGDQEIPGVVRTLEIVDATTGITLRSEDVNQKSSTSATDFKFTLDFTDFFTAAARRDFTIVAKDAEGNVKRRTITVTAVDVTCTCVQTLNYTQASALEAGGATKNLLMYKFASNVSKDGVEVTTEMFYDGEWRTLGTAVIRDSYSHSISIDPCDVFGNSEQLTHGSYPVRIQGVDVASGVKGNMVYTAVMCVDPKSTQPIVSLRFNDANGGTLRLYDSLVLEVAAYTPGKNTTMADVMVDGHVVSSVECQISQTYRVRKQIQGYAADGSEELTACAASGAVTTNSIRVRIEGSAIAAELKEGALFCLDFAGRSNSETDHTISDNGYTMEVAGSNWSSNGFGSYLGENCLRIAENVKARIDRYRPFGSAATELTNGMAFQFAFATNNIKDSEARLMECYDADSGAGFYVCGNKLVVTCKNGTPSVITRPFKCGEKHTVGIVVEPSTITVRRGSTDYSVIKVYMDGEEVGAIGYISNSGAILNQKEITLDGTEGDLYLYYALAYDSYYEWKQAFDNYLCKLTDTDAMIAEYEAEDLLDNQNRPSMAKFSERGIPYYVVVAPQATFDSFDSDINTSTKFSCTLYYFDPVRPWRSFKAVNVQWRRQGTTSAKRPVKNDRFYLRKPVDKKNPTVVTPLNPDYTNADALKTYELFGQGYVRVGEDTIPVAIITVKVDYSDSSMANDCGVCDMMNATFRALGTEYMTPAQRAFDGTWEMNGVTVEGLQMNHSTANHPIAVFRATNEQLTDAWFHARGNWKEDKGEQVALGFKDTPGYNKGCRNYGDFVEFFGKATFDSDGHFTCQETLAEIEARFKRTEGLDTSRLYLLSQYCGRDYRFMRYSGGEWAQAPGSMKQVNGKWVISGDVLNPVTGYELITYDGMDWFMGVGSIDDMMAPTETASSWVSKLSLGQPTYPAWTRYFECMVDDDQLQIDLAMGRKVPYELFNVLRFCDSCDYSKEALADTWGDIWKQNAWKYMSIESLLTYYTFTDYLAAVDQQAKNMQPMFFLEDGCSVENGTYSSPSDMEPVRMYENKVYDCDTCNSKDNDGGNTIPAELDPAEDDKCYAGRGSILWNNLRRCENQEMVCDAGGNTLTLPGVVDRMRNLPEIEGVGAGPFSPKGALHYFVRSRIEVWPKVVSTFDCERKYIKYSELYNDIYFYALHGSGRQSLPAFIEQRWRIRDGYYQTGDFKDASHVLGGRIGAKAGAKITFKAAKDGYFGIGNDGGNVTQGMYLKAGETGVFTQFQHGDNVLLYIYQADRMSEIDLSEISLDPNFQFSQMALVEKIRIGSATHRDDWRLSPGNTGFLENMNLGDLPFLRELDITGTEVTTVNASKCPRLERVLAAESALTTIALAETAPVETLELPETMTDLSLVNLPKLSYPGGLALAGLGSVQRLMLSGCPNVDPMALIGEIVKSSSIRFVRLPDVNITAPSSLLLALKGSGAVGLDPTGNAYEESGQCSGITGRWIMEDLIEDSVLAGLKVYFPQLEIHNSQYSVVCYTDTEDDTENITNLDNRTGYKYGKPYVASGHFKRLEELSRGVRGTFVNGVMHCVRLSNDDYNFLDDGTSVDLTDSSGMGYDFFKTIPDNWYKGVNDFKNQEKYGIRSTCRERPIATWKNIIRKKLADLPVETNAALVVTGMQAGDVPVSSENSNMNVYEMDVRGMKQVRWPGINNENLGCVFLDADGRIVSTFIMAVSHPLFDFMAGEDYIFTDVPAAAVTFKFTSMMGCEEQEAIAVDSAAIEAIEPDWVFAKQSLVAIYGLSVDSFGRARSVSGTLAAVGDGNGTSPEWTYDSEGNLTNKTIPSGLHYTWLDFINLCEMRGKGFHSISYEQSKDLANIIMELVGDRNIQAKCGYGNNTKEIGTETLKGKKINAWGNCTLFHNESSKTTLMFGIQGFVGILAEPLANVVINVPTFKQWKAAKYIAGGSSYKIDHRWHIYDPQTDTERVVKGITGVYTAYCIARVRFGRFMDTVPGRLLADSSVMSTNYSDGFMYEPHLASVVLRSGYVGYADNGLVHFNARGVANSSNYVYGARLAYSGEIVFDDEVTV